MLAGVAAFDLAAAAAFFTGAFFAATLAFAAGVAPVTAFFAAPRFAGALVFFVVAAALPLPASTFFGAAFFASTFFTAALGAALATAGFFTDAGLAAAVFDGGLLFYKYHISISPTNAYHIIHTSLDAALTLGASLTLPDGPLGRRNIPPSAPVAIARFSCPRFTPLASMPYFSSANFLIVRRDTPWRASVLFATIHSWKCTQHTSQVACNRETYGDNLLPRRTPGRLCILSLGLLCLGLCSDLLRSGRFLHNRFLGGCRAGCARRRLGGGGWWCVRHANYNKRVVYELGKKCDATSMRKKEKSAPAHPVVFIHALQRHRGHHLTRRAALRVAVLTFSLLIILTCVAKQATVLGACTKLSFHATYYITAQQRPHSSAPAPFHRPLSTPPHRRSPRPQGTLPAPRVGRPKARAQ